MGEERAVGREEGQPEADELVICRCEEVGEGTIVSAIAEGARTLGDIKRRALAWACARGDAVAVW